MLNKKTIKSSGQIPKGLLIFVGVIIIVIIIVFVVIKIVSGPSEPAETPEGEEEEEEEEEEAYQPVYEVVIGDIKFTFIKAKNKGNILRGSESKYPERQKDLITKEKFIEVTIGAQNIGRETIERGFWNIEEIIDSEGRKFELLTTEANPWIPEESECGAFLKPAFYPTPCTKIYEVARVSTDLKIKVFVGKGGIITAREEAFIDLKVY